MYAPLLLAFLTDLTSSEYRGKIYSLVDVINSFAMMLGPFIGGFLWTYIGQKSPFIMDATVGLIVCFLIILLRRL